MEEGTIAIVVLLIIGLPLAVGIWLIARAISARDRIEDLSRRVDNLQLELRRLKLAGTTPPPPQTAGEKPAPFAAASLPPKRAEEPAAVTTEKPVAPPPIPEPTTATPPTGPESGFTAPLPPEPKMPPVRDWAIGESVALASPAPAPETVRQTEENPPLFPPPLIPPLPEPAEESVPTANTATAAVPLRASRKTPITSLPATRRGAS